MIQRTARILSLAAPPLAAAALTTLLLLSGGCTGTGGPEPGTNANGEDAGTTVSETGRPLVVTTIPVLYSLTASLTGDTVQVENLLPAGTSPHQFNLSPSQGRLLQNADLLIMNGAGLEPWIDDLLADVEGTELRTVVASDGIELLAPPDYQAQVEGAEEEGSEEQHEQEGRDPHVWLDVENAMTMTENIQEALITLDSGSAADYKERGRAYRERLAALHSEIADRTAGLPHQDFVAFHSAFTYYAEAYGLRQVAVIESSPGRSPSPRYLTGLVDLIRDLGVQAVFTEPQFSPRSAEALAAETGVQTYEVDPEGSDLSPTMYEDLMRKNTDVFVQALGGN